MKNRDYCGAYETIDLDGVTYQYVADNHTGWWTYPGEYERACEKFGDDQDYEDFCGAMREPPPEIAAQLDRILFDQTH